MDEEKRKKERIGERYSYLYCCCLVVEVLLEQLAQWEVVVRKVLKVQ